VEIRCTGTSHGCGQEKVLARWRGGIQAARRLGESLATVQKFDVRSNRPQTSSLEALKAYSRGHQRAVELDPEFCLGLFDAGNMSMQDERDVSTITRAFQLREHASEREKLTIEGGYYRDITGELDKAERALRRSFESYPRSKNLKYGYEPHVMWAVCIWIRRYEEAAEVTRQSLRLCPNHMIPTLCSVLTSLPCSVSTRPQIVHDAPVREQWILRHFTTLSRSCFCGDGLRGDGGTAKVVAASPEFENGDLFVASDTEAYVGISARQRELTKAGCDSAVRGTTKKAGQSIWRLPAQREAAYGIPAQSPPVRSRGFKAGSRESGRPKAKPRSPLRWRRYDTSESLHKT